MPIDFYYVPGSPPCRSVRLVAAAVGVDLNLKLTDLMAGDQMKPEFVKINPMHCVPTINDNGFALWESRAIAGYLADQYGKNDSLYPKDPKQRALVDQRMYFDMGTMYQAFAEYWYPQIFAGAPADPEKLKKIDQSYQYLDQFLEGNNYVAGKNMTIADLVLLPTVTNSEVVDYDYSQYKNVARWVARMKSEAPKYEETNGVGVRAFKELKDKLSKK